MERYRVPDTQRIHWVSGPVFFLNRTFSAAWNIRYPDTSLKRGVSRPVNVLIFLDLPRIMECRWRTLQFLPFIFTKIPRYGLCYPNLYSKRSRHVKILFRRMRWNSTIREVSSVFTSPKFHGTWNTRDSNTTGIPRFMKLPMLKSWQNSLIRQNCNTFIVLNSTILSISMHDIEKTDTAFTLHWYLTICSLVSIALHCISGTYLWGCSIILKMIFNSSDHSTIFITAPVLFTLTNCPTQEGKTQVLNRVTSFILKFKYRNKVW